MWPDSGTYPDRVCMTCKYWRRLQNGEHGVCQAVNNHDSGMAISSMNESAELITRARHYCTSWAFVADDIDVGIDN